MPWQLLRISRQFVYANSMICDMQHQKIGTAYNMAVLILFYPFNSIIKCAPHSKPAIKALRSYVQEIEIIRKQLKTKHAGPIYKGYDRIQ